MKTMVLEIVRIYDGMLRYAIKDPMNGEYIYRGTESECIEWLSKNIK